MSNVTLDTAKARFNMVEQQVRPWDVLDNRVLALLAEVRREDFTPEAHRALAFADVDIPLSASAAQNGQYMLSPKVQARMVQDLDLQPTDNVLHIGTGTGYVAALLGRLARHVLSLEIDPALAQSASANLQRAGISNVLVSHADACAEQFNACRAGGPFHAILLSGSVAEVPDALLQLLTPGGRLLAIVGDEPMMRATRITRDDATCFSTQQPWDTVAPRLLNFSTPSRFSF